MSGVIALLVMRGLAVSAKASPAQHREARRSLGEGGTRASIRKSSLLKIDGLPDQARQ